MSLPESKLYTYADYLTWPEDQRIELVNGVPHVLHMQAGPSAMHQEILAELVAQFVVYLRGKNCKVYPAPFSVKLDVINVFEPDLSIICNKEKIDKQGCNGAPDLIIEILSPSSIKHDRFTKFKEYEKAGVKEYWIVEPEGSIVSVFTLDDTKRYGRPEIYDESIVVGLFPELVIDLGLVFGEACL
jgi:Uma2 family endonuclease